MAHVPSRLLLAALTIFAMGCSPISITIGEEDTPPDTTLGKAVQLDGLSLNHPDAWLATDPAVSRDIWEYAATGLGDDGQVTTRLHATGRLVADGGVDAGVAALSENYQRFLPGYRLQGLGDTSVGGADDARVMRFSYQEADRTIDGVSVIAASEDGPAVAIQLIGVDLDDTLADDIAASMAHHH